MKLSPHQRIIAWRLALQPLVTRAELIEAIWGWGDYDGGPLQAENSISIRICQLRRMLPVQINLRWGLGYAVPEAQRDRLLSILADEIAAADVIQPSQYIREAA